MNTVCRFVLNLAILAVFVTHALASLSRLRDLSGVNGNKINPLSLTIDSTSSRDEDALQTLFERISSVLLMESEYMEPLKLCIILSDIGHERMKDFCSAVVDDCMSKIRTLFVDKLATPKVTRFQYLCKSHKNCSGDVCSLWIRVAVFDGCQSRKDQAEDS